MFFLKVLFKVNVSGELDSLIDFTLSAPLPTQGPWQLLKSWLTPELLVHSSSSVFPFDPSICPLARRGAFRSLLPWHSPLGKSSQLPERALRRKKFCTNSHRPCGATRGPTEPPGRRTDDAIWLVRRRSQGLVPTLEVVKVLPGTARGILPRYLSGEVSYPVCCSCL